LRIKGLALAGVGETAGARELWLRVLSDDGEFAVMQGYASMEHLGDSYVDEDPWLAEHYYRRLLNENPSLNGTTHTQHIKLAELLIRRGDSQSIEEAATLLTQWAEVVHSPFPATHFRWNLALIAAGQAIGDRDTVRDAARRALDLAARGPVFPRHRTVGVVNSDAVTLKRLKKLAK
jgi:hypothetical protein